MTLPKCYAKDREASLKQINKNGPLLYTGQSKERIHCRSIEGNCQYAFNKRANDNEHPYSLFFDIAPTAETKKRRAVNVWANTLRILEQAAKNVEANTGYWRCPKCGHAWSTPNDHSKPKKCERPKCKGRTIEAVIIER